MKDLDKMMYQMMKSMDQVSSSWNDTNLSSSAAAHLTSIIELSKSILKIIDNPDYKSDVNPELRNYVMTTLNQSLSLNDKHHRQKNFEDQKNKLINEIVNFKE